MFELGNRRRNLLLIAAFAYVCSFFLPGSASAHHAHRVPGVVTGISIPNLSHDQLRVMSRYKGAVLSLADRQSRLDAEARALQNFVNLQFSYCLWGLVPDAISNEESPFNECTHAYLAGTKALLERLRHSAEAHVAADELAGKIDVAMLKEATLAAICGNGIEPFNSAEVIMPVWRGMEFNPLAMLLGAFLLLPGGAIAVRLVSAKRVSLQPG
jgi:hypothetical protein